MRRNDPIEIEDVIRKTAAAVELSFDKFDTVVTSDNSDPRITLVQVDSRGGVRRRFRITIEEEV